jgi:hypothetical protein
MVSSVKLQSDVRCEESFGVSRSVFRSVRIFVTSSSFAALC